MKASKALDEIHAIMIQIYEEEKGLSVEGRIKKRREETNKFLKERKLNLRWLTTTKESKSKAA